jgi:hypothetical protein
VRLGSVGYILDVEMTDGAVSRASLMGVRMEADKAKPWLFGRRFQRARTIAQHRQKTALLVMLAAVKGIP